MICNLLINLVLLAQGGALQSPWAQRNIGNFININVLKNKDLNCPIVGRKWRHASN